MERKGNFLKLQFQKSIVVFLHQRQKSPPDVVEQFLDSTYKKWGFYYLKREIF